MKIISEIKIKVNGELCVAQVTDEGYAIMPDGTQKKLSEQQFSAILEKVKAASLLKDEARPLTLPDAVPSTEKPVEQSVPMSVSKGEDLQNNEKPQKPQKSVKEPKAPKSPKEPRPAKEKIEKHPGSFAGAAAVLAVGIVIVVVMFFYATMTGIISFNNTPTPEVVIPPEASSSEQSSSSEIPQQATKEDLDEAQTILIIARIITPEGEEKEVVLGYFTTDGEDSALPEIGGGTEVTGNAADANGVQSENETSIQGNNSGTISLLKINQ